MKNADNEWVDSFSESFVRNRLIYVVVTLKMKIFFFKIFSATMKIKKEKEIEESIQIIVYLKIWHDDPRWSCDVLVARKCGPDIFIISIFSLCWWMFYVQCQELGGLFSTFFFPEWWRSDCDYQVPLWFLFMQWGRRCLEWPCWHQLIFMQ